MGMKLFVGGLSWDTTDETLRAAFAAFSEVTEARVITDRDTGRSRGFGFVTLTTAEAVQTAIAKLDGTTLDGRTIRVNEAQERSGGEGRSGGGGGRREGGSWGNRGGGGGGGGGGGRDRW